MTMGLEQKLNAYGFGADSANSSIEELRLRAELRNADSLERIADALDYLVLRQAGGAQSPRCEW